MKWLLLMLLTACGAKSTADAPLGAADTKQIRDLVHTAQTKADGYAKAREAGLRAAWRGIDAGTAPCSVSLPKLPLYRGWEEQTPADREAFDVAHWRMTVVPAAALMGEGAPPDEKVMQKIEREAATKGPRRDQFERQSGMLLRIADEGKVPSGFKDAAAVIALATEVGGDPYWGWELNVVAGEYRHPLFNPTGFEAGAVEGKALLWSFKEGRVVCAANVSARSQPEMKLEFNPKDQRMQRHQMLEDDLKIQAYRAAIDGLRAVP